MLPLACLLEPRAGGNLGARPGRVHAHQRTEPLQCVRATSGHCLLEALERYATRTMRERIARLERQRDPKTAIRTFVEDAIDPPLGGGSPPAWMPACELRSGGRATRCRASIPHSCLPRRNRGVLPLEHSAAAQAAGTVPRKVDAVDAARLLLGVVLGIRVLARTNPDRELLEGVARPALALLDDARPRDKASPKCSQSER